MGIIKNKIELIIEEELGKDCPSFVRDEIFEMFQVGNPLKDLSFTLMPPVFKTFNKRIIKDFVKRFYPKISQINVVEIKKQSEEFLSTESRVVDNSKSKNLVKRKFAVNKESSQTYITSLTATTTTKNELTNSVGLGFDWGGVKVSGSDEVKSAIDKSLQKEYSISETKKINLEDEIIVEVQPQTRTKILVHWKLIWQHGIVKVLDSWKREIEIPFKICSKITFDQEVIDE